MLGKHYNETYLNNNAEAKFITSLRLLTNENTFLCLKL